jgi:acetyl-CoA carboxylase biotin carboxyl carrier protein
MAKKTKSEAAGNQPVRGVDLEEVERLLEFMQKHRLEQFEYERDGVHILLKKASTRVQGDFRPAPVQEAGTHERGERPTAAPAPEAPEAAGSTKVADEGLHVVKSPIVGTFYAAASPGAEPFVRVGTQVAAGQVLCIIEAMKLMNEIEADVSGEIVKIFVENAHPVEYGERLFGIRVEGKK